ncbi:MAG: ATP-dependent DNA helicase [Gammaproteobacteria bacterium]|nr:ATP-dependent DNA helicase [Gammaproteobacteria bacterium]MDH5692210.1 ATP-dependent DNA helicase [Gammaproteobacteria bacterium]
MENLQDVLSDQGPLAKAIPHYKCRPQQLHFAERVEHALEHNESLVVEAGTGTGKTLAYLVPIFRSGKKCLVSTGTKNLQDQLYHRDIPMIRDALATGAVISLLKGRSNYLCHYRLHRHANTARFTSREQAIAFQKIQDWARTTKSGDIAEMSQLSEDSPVWSLATSTADSCLGGECEYISQCCVNEARARAQKADIVVINHHLFFADLALRDDGVADLLPACDAIVFDEAHQLADTGIQFFGTIISARQVLELINDANSECETDALELLSPLADQASTLHKIIDRLHKLLGTSNRSAWQDVDESQRCTQVVHELIDALETLTDLFSRVAEKTKGLANILERSENIVHRFRAFLAEDENIIRWFESRKNNFVLHKTPLEIAKPFQENMQRLNQSMIFTSATLSTGTRFDYFKQRLGLEEIETHQWASPFDYEHQSLLYLPEGIPEPQSPRFTLAVIEKAKEIIEICQGRTFVLFTSHQALNQAAEKLRNEIDFPILVQGEGSKNRLLEQFRTLENAVLLGTSSFWEGVDVKGRALSCVIIDKLPFASPGDPIIAARINELAQKGEHPFMKYQLPDAIITLRQGVGRLIRDETDRGVLVICDPRILSKSYGKSFLRSLPRIPITQDIQDVVEFMSEETA